MPMRQRDLFGQTLRHPPAELESPGAIWLARAAFWRENGWLPLGRVVVQRLEARWLAWLAERGAQPVWGASPELLAETEVRSWRHLPRLLWQPTVLQNERSRPAAGALGAAESPGLRVDALLPEKDDPLAVWLAVPPLPDLPLLTAETLNGSGWFFPHALGTETVLLCADCGYAAERAAARRAKPLPPEEAPRPLEAVSTPDCHTIADLCAFLNIPPQRTAKAVFLTMQREGREQLVFAVVRGDMDLNAERLAHLLGAEAMRPATAEEIRAAGAEPGYASPVGLEGVLVAVDDLIPHSPNLTAGANAPDLHLQNVNYGRDYQAALVADLAAVGAGDPCPHCQAPLRAQRAFRLAHLAGPRKLAAAYTDAAGQQRPLWRAALLVDLGRVTAALAEHWHDEDGLRWPPETAPYDLHLLWLPGKKMDTHAPAEALAAELEAAGWRVLLDDRDERPGVKFKDADLIGIPWRLTVGERALARNEVEVKRRSDGKRWQLPREEIVHWLQEAARGR